MSNFRTLLFVAEEQAGRPISRMCAKFNKRNALKNRPSMRIEYSVASGDADRRWLSEARVVNSWNVSIVASLSSGLDNGFGGHCSEYRLVPRSNFTFDYLPG